MLVQRMVLNLKRVRCLLATEHTRGEFWAIMSAWGLQEDGSVEVIVNMQHTPRFPGERRLRK